MFTPLSHSNISKIVDLMLDKLRARLESQNLKLEVTDAAKDLVIEGGYDVTFGARPLKRYIESNIETPVARIIVGGDLGEGSTIVVDEKEDKLVLSVK